MYFDSGFGVYRIHVQTALDYGATIYTSTEIEMDIMMRTTGSQQQRLLNLTRRADEVIFDEFVPR